MNVVIHALYDEAPDHVRYRTWLQDALSGGEPVGLSELVLSGFVRIVTNPRVFASPPSAAVALDAVDALRAHPDVIIVTPGDRHWSTFRRLCIEARARGNLVADAYHAALAIESGSELITTDGDFARFPSLRWRHPLRS
ncbi:MAG: type II toxin-antitoxin system VapC family toxin [Candidatus Limnocylindrales bacterium]